MKFFIMAIVCCAASSTLHAQNVAINSDGSLPHASAILDIKSTDKGLLIPRISLQSDADVTTISSPRLSLLVYNTNSLLPDGEGFYYWNGSFWTRIATRTNLDNLTWGTAGNAATDPSQHFIGTTDFKPLIFKTNNIICGKIDPGPNNTLWGQSAGESLKNGGISNSFFGQQSGQSTTTGSNNLFAGHNAGKLNTTGDANTFIGQDAGTANKTGYQNTFLGEDAGMSNVGGIENTFIGNGAGRNLTSSQIIAIGKEAMGGAATPLYGSIAIGHYAGHQAAGYLQGVYIGRAAGYHAEGCIAIGDSANYGGANVSGVAIGNRALKNVSSGFHNITVGSFSQENTSSGIYNVSVGSFALTDNTTGDYNTAVGGNALDNNITGNRNTAVGSQADFFGSGINNLTNTTIIGYDAKVSTSNTMVFGNGNVDRWAFGLNSTTGSHAMEVGDNSTNGNGAYLSQGGNWVNTCDANKKEDFSDLRGPDLLKKISQLNVQKWRYKGTGEYHIGPTAQQFYALFAVGSDDKGISTVDPAGIALAAIQEQQKMIESLKAELAALKQLLLQKK